MYTPQNVGRGAVRITKKLAQIFDFEETFEEFSRKEQINYGMIKVGNEILMKNINKS